MNGMFFLFILYSAVPSVSFTYDMQRALGNVVKIKINCDAEQCVYEKRAAEF